MPWRRSQAHRARCEHCRTRRIPCDGLRPCSQCRLRRIYCTGPPPRPGEPRPFNAQPADRLTALAPRVMITVPCQVFGTAERVHLSVFLRYSNTMIPLCLPRQVHAILTTNYSIALPLWDSPQALNAALHHATCALNWACIALGASVQRKVDDSRQFVFLAKQHLRYCYDVPTYESIMALLAVALVSFQIEPQGAFIRYANMAIILYVEIYETLSPAAARQVCAVLEYTHKLVYTERQFAHRQTPGLDDLLDKYAACNIDRWPSAPASTVADNLDHTFLFVRSMMVIWDNIIKILTTTESDDPAGYRSMLERVLAEGRRMGDRALDRIPAGTFWIYICLLLPCCRLQKLDQASAIALQCLGLVEKHPVIFNRCRKGTVPNMLLDVIDLLGDDSVHVRTSFLRTVVPTNDYTEGIIGDNEESFYMWLKQDLLHTLSTRQGSTAPGTSDSAPQNEDLIAAGMWEYLQDLNFEGSCLAYLEEVLADGNTSENTELRMISGEGFQTR